MKELQIMNLDTVKNYIGEIAVELLVNQDEPTYDFLEDFLLYGKNFKLDEQPNFFKNNNIFASIDRETENYECGITLYDFMKKPIVSVGLSGRQVVVIEHI